MAAHDAWALICRLFAGGTPVLRATLSPREASALIRERNSYGNDPFPPKG